MKSKLSRSLIAGFGIAVAVSGAYAQSASPAAPANTSEAAATAPAAVPGPGAGPGMMGQGRGMGPGQGMGPGSGMGPGQGMGPGKGMGPGNSGAGPRAMGPHGRGGEQGMGQLPQTVIDQLALTPAQKAQYDAAQAARKELWTNRSATRDAQHKAMAEQFAKDTIDPRAMLELRKKARADMETRMDGVSQKWLAFWDGLSAAQKATVSGYMKSQFAQRAQQRPRQPRG